MYQNNHFQNKPIIKFLFVLCFSFLICPAFASEDISRKLSRPKTETGYLTVSKQGGAQAKRKSSLQKNLTTTLKYFVIKVNEDLAFYGKRFLKLFKSKR